VRRMPWLLIVVAVIALGLPAVAVPADRMPEARDLVGARPPAQLKLAHACVERLDLWGDAGHVAGGDFLRDAQLGQLRPELGDLGLESAHRAPTCAAASEDRHRGQSAEGSAHPRRP